MSDLSPGQFKVFSKVEPRLGPGAYVFQMTQTMKEGGDTLLSAKAQDVHFKVSGSGIRLQPSDVLGVYPTSGDREVNTRQLPHVVLKQRTLPWLHSEPAVGGQPVVPSVALLLFKASEVRIVDGKASDHLTTAELREHFPSTAPSDPAVWLGVRQKILKRVMPRYHEELPYLSHVRQVSVADPEGKLDDDGYVAMVMANRVPTDADTEYVACLVALHPFGNDENLFPTAEEVGDPVTRDERPPFVIDPDLLRRMGMGRPVGTFLPGGIAGTLRTGGTAVGGLRPGGSSASVVSGVTLGSATRTPALSDLLSPDDVLRAEEVARVSPGALVSGISVLPGTLSVLSDSLLNLLLGPEKFLPVLTHFTFRTAAEAMDFEGILSAIQDRTSGAADAGVGMLGQGVTDSLGRYRMDHKNRDGESQEAIYGGPLRRLPQRRSTERTTALHADTLVSVEPDGDGQTIENVNLASAFELGRLLALSDRELLALLVEHRSYWQKQQRFSALTDALRRDLGIARIPEQRFGLGPLEQLHIFDKVGDPLGPLINPGPFEQQVVDPGGIDALVASQSVPGLRVADLQQAQKVGSPSEARRQLGLDDPSVGDILDGFREQVFEHLTKDFSVDDPNLGTLLGSLYSDLQNIHAVGTAAGGEG